MAVELGGGWKLLISSKMELEQAAQHRGLNLRDPPCCSPCKVDSSETKRPFIQNKPALSQHQHLPAGTLPLSFLLLGRPLCLKHGAGKKGPMQ